MYFLYIGSVLYNWLYFQVAKPTTLELSPRFDVLLGSLGDHS